MTKCCPLLVASYFAVNSLWVHGVLISAPLSAATIVLAWSTWFNHMMKHKCANTGVMGTADRTLQGSGCLILPLEIREKNPQNTKNRVSGPKLPHTSFPWCTMYLTSRPFRAQPLKSKTLINFAGREHNVFQVLLIAGWHSSSLCFWERKQWTLFSFNWNCWKFILLLLSLSARCWAKGQEASRGAPAEKWECQIHPSSSALVQTELVGMEAGEITKLDHPLKLLEKHFFSFFDYVGRPRYGTATSWGTPREKIFSLSLREYSFRRKTGILLNSFVNLLCQPHLGPSSGVCYCCWKAQGHYHW